ncbi:MAG: B12-binding domain-containing radical SAM protein [Thermoleophilia bacterium]|nr:B12-binding domain-containing radical SAM protein [Thermoleophilia bacterium]
MIKPKDVYTYSVMPNLGLGYLAASLRESGLDAVILDCNKEDIGPEDFRGYLSGKEFHLIGFQVYTSGIPSARRMVHVARALNEEAILVLGGPHPSGDVEQTFSILPDVDCAVVGEGEEAIVELMKLDKGDLDDKTRLAGIKNVAYPVNEGEVCINEIAQSEDLATLPRPAWDLIDPRTYPISPHGTFSRGYPVAPVLTSRGCPYPCTFCAAFKVFGRKIRYRPAEDVVDEIEYLVRNYGIKEFHIEDDNFTMKKDYVMEFTSLVKRRNLRMPWACPNGIRLDRIDAEMLEAMEDSGCYSVAVGIESGSDDVLRRMRKKLTTDQIEEKVDLIKNSSNLNVTGFFLLGYPGETVEEIKKTIRFSRRLKLNKASFSPVMPLPGTEIYSDWRKKVPAEDFDWNKFLYYQIIPFVSEIDSRVLEKFVRKAVIGFYVRPRVIWGMAREIKTLYQLKVILKRIWTVLFNRNFWLKKREIPRHP